MLKEGAVYCAVLAAILGYINPDIFFADTLPHPEKISREPPEAPEPKPWNSTKPLFEIAGPFHEDNPVNLVDEGLTEWLGGAFSFMVTFQMDDINEWSRIFDFSLSSEFETIGAGNIGKGCDLHFTVMKEASAVEIFVPDFFQVGKEAKALFTISNAGVMSVYRDGELLGENVQAPPPNYVERPHLMVGNHHTFTHQGFRGSLKDVKVWNQEVTWPKEPRKRRRGKGRR